MYDNNGNSLENQKMCSFCQLYLYEELYIIVRIAWYNGINNFSPPKYYRHSLCSSMQVICEALIILGCFRKVKASNCNHLSQIHNLILIVADSWPVVQSQTETLHRFDYSGRLVFPGSGTKHVPNRLFVRHEAAAKKQEKVVG